MTKKSGGNTVIDPLISLAFSVYSNRGVYALLLGSGVSHDAEIPTSWEIVNDLIRRLAKISGEDCEPDPALWYKKKLTTRKFPIRGVQFSPEELEKGLRHTNQ